MTRKTRRSAKTAKGLVTTLCGAFALAVPSVASAEVGFSTPSRNIVCFVERHPEHASEYLQCLVFDNGWDTPPLTDCGLDETDSVILPYSGSAKLEKVCHGDVWWPLPLATLGYGSTWSHRALECAIETTGVHCENATGGGFSIRRATAKLK